MNNSLSYFSKDSFEEINIIWTVFWDLVQMPTESIQCNTGGCSLRKENHNSHRRRRAAWTFQIPDIIQSTRKRAKLIYNSPSFRNKLLSIDHDIMRRRYLGCRGEWKNNAITIVESFDLCSDLCIFIILHFTDFPHAAGCYCRQCRQANWWKGAWEMRPRQRWTRWDHTCLKVNWKC